MSQVVKMLSVTGTPYEDPLIFCPGCKCGHIFPVAQIHEDKGRWQWNGSKDKPTFTPSMLVNKGEPNQCHSVVTDGMIAFGPDCYHELKGQTVSLQPFTEDMW